MRGYCPACGITVEGDVSFEEGRQLFRCTNCTFPIMDEPKKSSSSAKPVPMQEPTVESAKQMLAEMMDEGGQVKALFHTIVIAEDSQTMRSVLKLALEKHRI